MTAAPDHAAAFHALEGPLHDLRRAALIADHLALELADSCQHKDGRATAPAINVELLVYQTTQMLHRAEEVLELWREKHG
jgi:hypothetical protein